MECLLEAVSETLQYIGVSVRNPYGLRIDRGRTYAVVGENGCGKTVLANILARGWNIGRNRILGDKQSLRVKVVEFPMCIPFPAAAIPTISNGLKRR